MTHSENFIVVHQPYGKNVKFLKSTKKNNHVYYLIDAFPNYGDNRGHQYALNVAKVERERGNDAFVVAKVGASAAYARVFKIVAKKPLFGDVF